MSERVEISKRLVLINSASSLATRLLGLSVLVWLQPYLLNRVSAAEYALLPVLYSVLMFAPVVTTVLTGGLGRFIVEAYAKNDEERVTQIVSTMFPLLCFAGVVFLGGGWLLAWHVGSILDVEADYLWDAQVMMAMLMFSSAIRLPLSPFGVGYFVRQRFVLENVIGVGCEIFRLALLFSLLLFVSTRVIWVIGASVSAEVLALLIGVIVSRRLVPALRFQRDQIRWYIARELTSFGGWVGVGTFADAIRKSSDIILLNKFGTPLDVSVFHIGSMPQRKLEEIRITAMASLGPPLTAMHATNDGQRLANAYCRIGRFGLWVSLFFVLPPMVYCQELMALYVPLEFQSAAIVMFLLLTTYPLTYGNLLAPAIAAARGKVATWHRRAIVMNGANFALTVYLVCVLDLGAIGCAFATFIVQGVLYPLLFWPLGLRLSGVSWRRVMAETIVPGFLPALTATIFWVFLKFSIVPISLTALGVCTASGWIVYMIMLWNFCLQTNDSEELRNVVRRVGRKIRMKQTQE